ncbi:MAG: STAS domain-containing protein [Gammaproteobacteria bacterium]|nr:STAS domain-containing protein [Gammaproteobacteria bacterium]
MTDLQINFDDGQILLSGDITYETVSRALKLSLFPLDAATDKSILVDFSGIGHADSSGLALMIHWLREGKTRSVDIQFIHIPPKLIALAGMSNLEEVLPIS